MADLQQVHEREERKRQGKEHLAVSWKERPFPDLHTVDYDRFRRHLIEKYEEVILMDEWMTEAMEQWRSDQPIEAQTRWYCQMVVMANRWNHNRNRWDHTFELVNSLTDKVEWFEVVVEGANQTRQDDAEQFHWENIVLKGIKEVFLQELTKRITDYSWGDDDAPESGTDQKGRG